ncbi:MAG: hypothetical protein AAB221_07845 [Bacteroidota bacterium]
MRFTGRWGYELKMKNISEIKERLIVWRDSGRIEKLVEQLSEESELNEKLKVIVKNASLLFINKLIKHLDSKRPGKASISDLLLKSFYKLGEADNKLAKCFLAVAVEGINNNFQDAFLDRLNVKSKEFLDLEDCGPF